MYYISNKDTDRLKKLWHEIAGVNAGTDYSDDLLDELFENQGKSLSDSISLVSGSISKRKTLSQRAVNESKDRIADIQIALRRFPPGTCYPHIEARRAHLERELDKLILNTKEEEVSMWKDIYRLYKGLIYLTYKKHTSETVKRNTIDVRRPLS